MNYAPILLTGEDTFNLPDNSSQELQILVSAQENDSPSNFRKEPKPDARYI